VEQQQVDNDYFICSRAHIIVYFLQLGTDWQWLIVIINGVDKQQNTYTSVEQLTNEYNLNIFIYNIVIIFRKKWNLFIDRQYDRFYFIFSIHTC
jgi:hypothetical protein